jgi:hypothetical protein
VSTNAGARAVRGVVSGWMSDTQRVLVRLAPGSLIEAAVAPHVGSSLRAGTRVIVAGTEGERHVAWVLVDLPA